MSCQNRLPEKPVTLPCDVSKHFNNRWQANLREKKEKAQSLRL